VVPSKGKRKQQKQQQNAAQGAPPAPELAAYVDVGLASISRGLEGMCSKDRPGGDTEPYSVIFVARSGQSSAFHCHFPQMVAVASNFRSSRPAIRLVGFSKPCEGRLSAALGIPRVSSIALREGAPQTKALLDYVCGHVGPVDVAWIREAQSADYRGTKTDAVPTKVGVAKSKRVKFTRVV